MRSLSRMAAACAVIVLSLSARICAQTPATAVSSISGTVVDEVGAPVSGAAVALRGPSTYATVSDVKGDFAFNQIVPGLYALAVRKAGYTTAVQGDIAVLSGQVQTIAVRLSHETFSSLRTIATVRVNGHGTINTSAASVNVVSTQTFIDQSQPQVTRVLSQVPGLQISFPSNSANAAAPGAITIPNIRGATSYETASLIDGHPISVGQYGDNVTTFLNSFMFGSVEVIKGPGADSPVVNNAIGGTTNFRTKDPTLTEAPEVLAGVDSRGGTFSNFSISDTLGKVGFVVDVATQDNPSALEGKQVYYDPSFGVYNGLTLNGNASATQLYPTASFLTNQFPLLACCYTLHGNLDQTAALLKVRYKFSSATTATVSYLGGQSSSDQNGNTSDFIRGQFIPNPGYSGTLKPGPVMVANVFPGAFSGEYNNEPIFQAEVGTTLGKDSILARYYHASILRFQFQGSGAAKPDYNNVTLYGTTFDFSGNPVTTYNGTPAGVGYYDFYQEPELDKLAGGTLEYQHPVGDGLITLSADRTIAQSTDYVYNSISFQPPAVSFNLPPGTTQTLSTYLARAHFYMGSKLDVTLSNYLNTYSSTYPVNCPKDSSGNCTSAAAQLGTGVTFQTTNNTHDDPRLGAVYRLSQNAALRFAVGSSIAPPFLGLLNQITSAPAYNPQAGVAIESQSNGNLKPETAFGYDLGSDVRLNDGVTILSGDIYDTDLYNRFFGQTVDTGHVCGPSFPCAGAPTGTPILNQTNTNISNARFEGIELSVHHDPAVGFGFELAGALQRGYYYDLPPYFYCSLPGPGCLANQNLNIIAGQNTNGVTNGNYPLDAEISYNGNMRLPYAQGNVQLSYTFLDGIYAMFGETLYGHNNSLNEPAFGIAYGTLRVPITKSMSFQVSGDNIFNAYPGYLPILGAGVAIPLAAPPTQADGSPPPPGTPALAASTGNVLGPATYRFSLDFRLP